MELHEEVNQEALDQLIQMVIQEVNQEALDLIFKEEVKEKP